MVSPSSNPLPASSQKESLPKVKKSRLRNISKGWMVFLIITFLAGNGSGFLINERLHLREQKNIASQEAQRASQIADMAHQVNPPNGYRIKVHFGEVGPEMLAAGAINYDAFLEVYERSGRPLSEPQLAILNKGSRDEITINKENAYFLLNFFWALGLTNKNTILTEGPMVTNSQGQVENFASTGGWTIAAKPIRELYASAEIISLTPEQQEHLEHVAQNVYRPCCNNPTHFPDCNHGMAMLGLLQLMASQDATREEMFEAAKYFNAFWYPSQTLEIATFYKEAMSIDFSEVDARQLVSKDISSGSGYQVVRQWLASNGFLQQTPSGGSCGV
jgi:hypothetical protein